MSLGLLFWNIIIPIEKISDFGDLLSENDRRIGANIWYDEHLYREGAMGYGDIEHMLEYWQSRGLVGNVEGQEAQSWSDLCVVASQGVGPEARCDWLTSDPSRNCVSHVLERHGKVVVHNPFYLVRPNFAGSVVVGRFRSSSSVSRGMVVLNDDYIAFNYDSKGFFRFAIGPDQVKVMNKERNYQRLCIYDFISERQHEYEFELHLGKANVLEIQEGEDTAPVEYGPIDSSIDHSMDEFLRRLSNQ